jgi:hypothetical protein
MIAMATPDDPSESAQLPAVLPSASPLEVAALHAMIPTLIADAGDQAARRYVDFFTTNTATRTPAAPTCRHVCYLEQLTVRR